MTKLLLKVIQQRIVDSIDKEVSQQQRGFRPGTGTRESIFNLRTICLLEWEKLDPEIGESRSVNVFH